MAMVTRIGPLLPTIPIVAGENEWVAGGKTITAWPTSGAVML